MLISHTNAMKYTGCHRYWDITNQEIYRMHLSNNEDSLTFMFLKNSLTKDTTNDFYSYQNEDVKIITNFISLYHIYM